MSSPGPEIVTRSSGANGASEGSPGGGAFSPPALRPARNRWRDPRLVVGLAVVAVCALLGARALAAADDTVQVWAARVTLEAGQRVGPGDLVRREVRFADQAGADRYLSPGSALPSDAAVDRRVGAGELLPRSALGGPAAASLTEVPLSVGTEAVPATVREGSVVDVWVTPQVPGSGENPAGSVVRRATLVFDDVPVVSAPATGTSLGPTATRQLVVGIGADQNARLPRSIAALARGDVTLTSRR
jgi:hypothetical protein